MTHLQLLFFVLFSFGISHSQTFVPFYGEVSSQCSSGEILANLTAFNNFGVKYRNTAAQANTLQWLKDKYASYGYSASSIVEDPFSYSGSTCKNLVVTKTGTLYPNTYVIVCGHYDTVNGPGTNDNGSGVSAILEIARLLENVPTEYSIKFINFAGEEDGLVGSQHFVSNVVNATTPKMDIRLVLNLDQVGGVAGETNNTITCERDQSNPSANNAASNVFTNELANCIELYSDLQTSISFAYGSDYVPFENNGEVITGLYEFNESPYPHTANDVLANMDPNFVYQVTKGAVGAVMHFAVACTNCSLAIGESQIKPESIALSPNPANSNVTVTSGVHSGHPGLVAVVDVAGKTVIESRFDQVPESFKLDLRELPSGLYFVKIDSDAGSVSQKLIIE